MSTVSAPGTLANSSGSVPFSAPMVTVTSIPDLLVIASDWVAVVFTTTLPKSICCGFSATGRRAGRSGVRFETGALTG